MTTDDNRAAATDEERGCLTALAGLPEIGPATVLACHRGPGAERTWSALVRGQGASIEPLARWVRGGQRRSLDKLTHLARACDPMDVLAAHRASNVEVEVLDRVGYPLRLQADPVPPAVLYRRGVATLDERQAAVAIVGTRNATRLGCQTAAQLAHALADRGIDVVSGLALGIDGAAHQALVQSDARDAATGMPVGVVASGLDLPYPRRHTALHRAVEERGVVVSETPLGGAPLRWRFPARNRIIAGLVDAVVVVESRSAGGAMLTAGEALARGVPVLAVPGHPSSASAAGPLDLLSEGATPLRDVDDVLVAIGRGGQPPVGHGNLVGAAPGADVALDDELGICDLLRQGPRSVSELVEDLGLSLAQVAAGLIRLESAGSVVRTGSWYELGGAR